MKEELKSSPEFKAKRCSLVGVQPTGTTNGEWSSLSKAFTSERLTENYVYISFIVKN
jgi:hypothetical protein